MMTVYSISYDDKHVTHLSLHPNSVPRGKTACCPWLTGSDTTLCQLKRRANQHLLISLSYFRRYCFFNKSSNKTCLVFLQLFASYSFLFKYLAKFGVHNKPSEMENLLKKRIPVLSQSLLLELIGF